MTKFKRPENSIKSLEAQDLFTVPCFQPGQVSTSWSGGTEGSSWMKGTLSWFPAPLWTRVLATPQLMRIMEKTGMDLIFTEIAEGLPTTSYFSFCKNDGSEKCISFQPRLILLGIYVRFHRGVGAPRTWKKITLVGSWRMLPLMVHGFWRSLVEETVVYPNFCPTSFC